jgi:hypothetical protein
MKNKNEKRLTNCQEQAEKGFKCMEEPSWNFEQNQEPNCISLYPRLKYNANSRLN